MKTIKVSEDNWLKLMKLKLKLELKSLDDVIFKYHQLITRLKLNKILEDLE